MRFRCDRCWSALGEGDEVGVAEDLAAGFPEVTAISHEAVTASGLSQTGLQGSRYLCVTAVDLPQGRHATLRPAPHAGSSTRLRWWCRARARTRAEM
jgi:hypothetical protein